MRVHQIRFQDEHQLIEWIDSQDIQDSKRLLVLIYTYSDERPYIESLIALLNRQLPQSFLLGCTSFSGIVGGSIYESSTIISFLEFETTELRCSVIPTTTVPDGESLGVALGRSLAAPDMQAMIVFTSLLPDIEPFLAGLESAAPGKILAGGISANEECRTVLFTKEGIITDGAAGVSLSGPGLLVHNNYCLNWQPIGKSFKVTRAEGDRVYSVDNMSVVELYAKYLGDKIAWRILDKSSQFPFLLQRNGIEIGRDVKAIHEDGSVTLSGSLYNGETVRLGFGDPELIIESSARLIDSFRTIPAEAVLVYSCEARRRFMYNSIQHELAPLEAVGPASGFFTSGEFFHYNGRNMVINHSMTLLLLSESPSAVRTELEQLNRYEDRWGDLDALKAMWHLAQVSTDELLQLNLSLEASEQRYKSLVEFNPDIVYSVDYSGSFRSRNQAFYEMLGYTADDAPGSILDTAAPEYHWIIRQSIRSAFQGSSQTFEISLYHKNGLSIPFTVTKLPIVVNGEIVGVYGIAKNISERKEAEQRITFMAYHDVLTELPNRTLFYKSVAGFMNNKEVLRPGFAVLFLDLDHFKDINDAYGHFAGDKILQLVAAELNRLLDGRGIAARFGGDEFAVALRVTDPEQVAEFSRRLVRFFRRPFSIEGEELFVTASVGVSFYPQDGTDPETLLKNADIAMYGAKQSGKNRYQFYRSEISDQTREKRSLAHELRKAIQDGELEVFYQPLMDLKTHRLMGSEALVRWRHKERGYIPPSQFIPVAEEYGLIEALGNFVLYTACLQHRSWQNRYGMPQTVSVNVSSRQFQQPEFAFMVQDALQDTGMEPHWLNLEITESTALIDLEHTKVLLAKLQKLGITISMDDFGTGYSSLSCVKDLSIDKLKIDKSFMVHITTDERDAAIVKTIIALSRNLGMKVLAEGVETLEQLEKLCEYNCDEVQGYWFSPPVPAEEFEARFLKQTDSTLLWCGRLG